MPEFPLLKSQIGQVEWNGGSTTTNQVEISLTPLRNFYHTSITPFYRTFEISLNSELA